jgi:hypothetical protein
MRTNLLLICPVLLLLASISQAQENVSVLASSPANSTNAPNAYISYEEHAGPWTAAFSSSSNLTTKSEHLHLGSAGLEAIADCWAVYLKDSKGDDLVYMIFYEYRQSMPLSNNSLLDWMIGGSFDSLKIRPPSLRSIKIDGADGRIGQGYASEYRNAYRIVNYPYYESYNSTYDCNVTKDVVGIYSMQGNKDFKEMIRSVHVTKL